MYLVAVQLFSQLSIGQLPNRFTDDLKKSQLAKLSHLLGYERVSIPYHQSLA